MIPNDPAGTALRIKAIPFMTKVKNWALAKGIPFCTWSQQQEAILDYVAEMKRLEIKIDNQ